MQIKLETENTQVTDKRLEPTEKPSVNEPCDQYPGTFFRIPGVPLPGKTTWSLAK